tara:strand:- start:98 stop:337 length:240 start_codon:yes stop_codon:yes gene_type:complete
MLKIVLGYKGRKPSKSEDPKVIYCGNSASESREKSDAAKVSGKFGLVGFIENSVPRYQVCSGKPTTAAAPKKSDKAENK